MGYQVSVLTAKDSLLYRPEVRALVRLFSTLKDDELDRVVSLLFSDPRTSLVAAFVVDGKSRRKLVAIATGHGCWSIHGRTYFVHGPYHAGPLPVEVRQLLIDRIVLQLKSFVDAKDRIIPHTVEARFEAFPEGEQGDVPAA